MYDLNKKIKEAEAKLSELKKMKEEITNEYEDLVLTSKYVIYILTFAIYQKVSTY